MNIPKFNLILNGIGPTQGQNSTIQKKIKDNVRSAYRQDDFIPILQD